jgi:hypothetical protein
MGKLLKYGHKQLFSDRILIAQEIRARIDKWDSIKVKSFYTSKGTINRIKTQPTEWKKIFASYSLDKGLYPEYAKSSKN